MINAISGILCHKGLDSIRIDNHGVEWEFPVPARSVEGFGRLGDSVRVLTWLLHREDQMKLYGFPSEAERTVFLELLTVDGIGPKQALKILGGIGADELERALEGEDLARLEAIPGLGKKTAQKLVFSLKGKLPSSLSSRSRPESEGPHEDIVRALADLGYDRKRAAEAVRAIASESSSLPADSADRERELFRRAMVALSGA
ncbi:MAG TPA: Holliday junction branch migration protein RuvA [Spirochaetaceae bacterium]|jgi:Holliday junction DNA helicase RuvA|nr:Holliday junction branch migration protein RuvA [Spirochaetaceae bacterium]